MLVLAIAVQIVLFIAMRMNKRVSNDELKLKIVMLTSLLIIVAIACYRFYQIGFTDRFVGNWFYDKDNHMAGDPLSALVKFNLFVYLKYVTPVAFIAMIFSLINNRITKCKGAYFVFAYVLFFAFIRLVATDTTPYQYYYARYLFAEIVPCTLFLAALFLGSMLESERKSFRIGSLITVIIIAVYFASISSFQLKGREGDGAALALSKVAGHLDENKLLIYKFENGKGFEYPDSQIITPLLFYYNLNMLFISNMDDLNSEMFAGLLNRFREAYIMSKEPISSNKLSCIDLIGYKHGMFNGTSGIPNKFDYTKFDLYLYRLKPL
jgi:hypothetical protein